LASRPFRNRLSSSEDEVSVSLKATFVLTGTQRIQSH
jgi:hypothetical protein